MSQKKKISKADVSAAIQAVDVLLSYVEKGLNDKSISSIGFAFLTETPVSIRPFDMVANGAKLFRVRDCDIVDLFSRWQKFIGCFDHEEGFSDLSIALLMLGQWLRMSNCGDISIGAFVGVYGVFRVSLEKCILSAGARLHGGMTIEERAGSAEVRAEIASRSADIAKVVASGVKTKDDYLLVQRHEFFITCMEIREDGGKPGITGEHGVLHDIWSMRKMRLRA